MSMITSLAAIIAILIFTGLGIFQLMLALGKPYGKAAYGGKYEVLPDNLRYMSGVAVLIFLIASIFVAVEVEFIVNFPYSDISNIAVWAFAIYLLLNTIMNFLSKSDLEKKLMTPLSFTASICLFIVALNL